MLNSKVKQVLDIPNTKWPLIFLPKLPPFLLYRFVCMFSEH